ncbi:MAG: U32 family peptidase [Alphaproteobacteria bacterium]|nr:U32 family peptidase [Alphaproteobacteria bacterium]
MRAARLTLGPLLFNWPAERVADLYRRIADEAPVDGVVLGEVVCAKRPVPARALAEAVERLERAGKEVVFATLALVMQPRERRTLRELVEQADRRIEANDATALALLRGRPHLVGPYVGVYNEAALAVLAAGGAHRVCLGPELSLDMIGRLAAAALSLPDMALEVVAFGRLPLAISARCYHARAHGLHKDGCRFVCGRDPDGLAVDTLDGEPFLAVNGVQVLSGTHASLMRDLPALRMAGIDRFRLSPHSGDMVAVAELFRAALDGRIDPAEGQRRLASAFPEARFANGFLQGGAGKFWLDQRAAATVG